MPHPSQVCRHDGAESAGPPCRLCSWSDVVFREAYPSERVQLTPLPPPPMQLGAKKGLGAQKVSSKSFSEVEKQAQVAEKLREEQAAVAKKQAEESM